MYQRKAHGKQSMRRIRRGSDPDKMVVRVNDARRRVLNWALCLHRNELDCSEGASWHRGCAPGL